jgi:hypothetical protein
VTLDQVSFEGHDAVRLRRGEVEVVVAIDVGPRVLGLIADGRNLFAVLPGAGLDVAGYPRFTLYGGHRLWAAPEEPAVTYQPDDRPCAVTEEGEGIRVEAPRDGAGLVRTISIHPDGDAWAVGHELRNESPDAMRVAPWAITQCAVGGVADITLGGAGEGLQADRSLVLWPYTDLADPRLTFARDAVHVEARPEGPPLKLGVAPSTGTLAYRRDGWRFEKRVSVRTDAEYADRGAVVQVYACDRFCELETFGPLQTLAAGASAHLDETWRVARDGAPS